MDCNVDIGSTKMLLAHADPRSRDMLAGMLEPVTLPVGALLVTFGEETRDAYFLRSGLASVIARSPKKKKSEIGMIGREGIAPALPVLSRQPSLFDVVMTVEGRGYRIANQSLHETMEKSPPLRQLLERYVEAFLVGSAYALLAVTNHSQEERVARCLLMCHDRLDGNEIPLTHKTLAAMALIDSSAIDDVLQRLGAQKLIKPTRRRVIVTDRPGLETVARDCYGRAEYAYRRLIGEFR
jgi:CRP-like cAMP-binding protein